MKSQLIAIVAALLVVGCSNHEAEANKLFVKASTVPQREAVEILEKILVQYPETSLAVGISGGSQKINGYSLEEIKLDIKRQEWEEKKRRQGIKDNQMMISSKSGDIHTFKLSLTKDDAGISANVNAYFKGWTALHYVSRYSGHKEIAELLIANGANVNAKQRDGFIFRPLDHAEAHNQTEIADLLRKHGGKTGEELKAEGK
jgi:hypothetical protein